MSEQWLSIVEYARQTNMSDMTVRRRIKTGRIQAVLRDGKYYIPMSEAIKKISAPTSHQQQAPSKGQSLHRATPNHSAYLHQQQSPMMDREQQFNIPPPSMQTLMPPPSANAYSSATERPVRSSDPFAGIAASDNQRHFTEEKKAPPSSIPAQFRSSLSQKGGTLASVDSSTLIAFCEGALRKANDAEQRLEAYYKEAIGKLECEVKSRDHQIRALAQQVEDLQLLTKILEKKK